MKIALRTSPGRVLLLDAGDIYYVEAHKDATRVRTAGKRLHHSPLTLGEWKERLSRQGFFQIHRSYLVNLDRVREVRLRRGDPNDWEVKLDPPVNAVLPLSREGFRLLRRRLGF